MWYCKKIDDIKSVLEQIYDDFAVEHVQMLAIAIYKALRISENAQKALTAPLNESSTKVSAKALNEAVVVDPDEGR